MKNSHNPALCSYSSIQVQGFTCSYRCDPTRERQPPGYRHFDSQNHSCSQSRPASVRHTATGALGDARGYISSTQAVSAHTPGKLMDLVYPPPPDQPPFLLSQAQHSTAVGSLSRSLSRTHCPSLIPCHGSMHALQPRIGAKRHSPTWLVGEMGEWRKRRAPCMCQHTDCPGLSSQQGLAYIATRLVKMGNRMERYFDFRKKRELRLGKPIVDQKCGLRLAESAHMALSLLGQADLKCNDVVVLRGVASGMGCRHGHVIYAPSFRPVCAMDYIVTKY